MNVTNVLPNSAAASHPLPPHPREHWKARLRRWAFNWFPAFWGTGARLIYLEERFREIRLALPLTLRTRNYVGTIFGGSMFAACDPILMVMLIERLGRGFVVWDKAGTIRFRKPGRTTLYARFLLPDDELEKIRSQAEREGRVERVFTVDLVDAAGLVHASIEKTIVIKVKASCA